MLTGGGSRPILPDLGASIQLGDEGAMRWKIGDTVLHPRREAMVCKQSADRVSAEREADSSLAGIEDRKEALFRTGADKADQRRRQFQGDKLAAP